MELKNNKPFFVFSAVWVSTLLAIAIWWIYLFINIGESSSLLRDKNFSRMIKWEGSVFITLLIIVSVSLFIYIFKDQRKTKSMQAFFASLTHELKTPLASVRLQAEVINDHIDSFKSKAEEKDDQYQIISPYVQRLIQDVVKLESHMDKVLQLSRIERGGTLNIVPINLVNFLDSISKETDFKFTKNIIDKNIDSILVDEFALRLIFRNLVENSKLHAKTNEAKLSFSLENNKLKLEYKDGGSFKGDSSLLTNLFYKHQSSKGSGIGLYIIDKLMKKMDGKLLIKNDHEIRFYLYFKLVQI